MFGISRTTKCGAAILAAAIMLVTFALPSYADSGTVRFRITRAGFIVGAGGGTGTLVFHGRTYPLSVGGLSVGTIGAATADVVGRASNLRRASDIVGTYTAVGAGIADCRWGYCGAPAEPERRCHGSARTAGRS